jgi:hypothetical protein
MRLHRKSTFPTVRMIDFQRPSSQRWKQSISREISALKIATHVNICNIIGLEGSDMDAIRLTLEPAIGMSLRDILLRSSPTEEQMSCILSGVSDSMFICINGAFV